MKLILGLYCLLFYFDLITKSFVTCHPDQIFVVNHNHTRKLVKIPRDPEMIETIQRLRRNSEEFKSKFPSFSMAKMLKNLNTSTVSDEKVDEDLQKRWKAKRRRRKPKNISDILTNGNKTSETDPECLFKEISETSGVICHASNSKNSESDSKSEENSSQSSSEESKSSTSKSRNRSKNRSKFHKNIKSPNAENSEQPPKKPEKGKYLTDMGRRLNIFNKVLKNRNNMLTTQKPKEKKKKDLALRFGTTTTVPVVPPNYFVRKAKNLFDSVITTEKTTTTITKPTTTETTTEETTTKSPLELINENYFKNLRKPGFYTTTTSTTLAPESLSYSYESEEPQPLTQNLEKISNIFETTTVSSKPLGAIDEFLQKNKAKSQSLEDSGSKSYENSRYKSKYFTTKPNIIQMTENKRQVKKANMRRLNIFNTVIKNRNFPYSTTSTSTTTPEPYFPRKSSYFQKTFKTTSTTTTTSEIPTEIIIPIIPTDPPILEDAQINYSSDPYAKQNIGAIEEFLKENYHLKKRRKKGRRRKPRISKENFQTPQTQSHLSSNLENQFKLQNPSIYPEVDPQPRYVTFAPQYKPELSGKLVNQEPYYPDQNIPEHLRNVKFHNQNNVQFSQQKIPENYHREVPVQENYRHIPDQSSGPNIPNQEQYIPQNVQTHPDQFESNLNLRPNFHTQLQNLYQHKAPQPEDIPIPVQNLAIQQQENLYQPQYPHNQQNNLHFPQNPGVIIPQNNLRNNVIIPENLYGYPPPLPPSNDQYPKFPIYTMGGGGKLQIPPNLYPQHPQDDKIIEPHNFPEKIVSVGVPLRLPLLQMENLNFGPKFGLNPAFLKPGGNINIGGNFPDPPTKPKMTKFTPSEAIPDPVKYLYLEKGKNTNKVTYKNKDQNRQSSRNEPNFQNNKSPKNLQKSSQKRANLDQVRQPTLNSFPNLHYMPPPVPNVSYLYNPLSNTNNIFSHKNSESVNLNKKIE